MKFLKLLKIIEKCAGCALIGACLCMATACEKQGKKAVDTDTTQQSNEINEIDGLFAQVVKDWREIQANTTLKVSKTTDNKIKLEAVAIINEKKEITIEEVKAQLKWLGFKVID